MCCDLSAHVVDVTWLCTSHEAKPQVLSSVVGWVMLASLVSM